MKKLKKYSSAGTNDESSTNAQVGQVCQPIAKPHVIRRLEDVMLQLGEVHNMLARTPLSKENYNPISSKFAVAKVELFNIYNELKNEITWAHKEKRVLDGCSTCKNNIPGIEAGNWCITHCISGSMYEANGG